MSLHILTSPGSCPITLGPCELSKTLVPVHNRIKNKNQLAFLNVIRICTGIDSR